MLLKRIINQVVVVFANTSYSRKIAYLQRRGCVLGKGTRLNCKIKAFGSEPWLIRLGDNCLIADEVKFITHDGGVKVCNQLHLFGEGANFMDKMARIDVGDNVYIGTGAMIMPGTNIGNNCIIGGYAVVTHDIPENSVAVGIPAKIIKTVDQYFEDANQKGMFYPTGNMKLTDKRRYYEKKGIANIVSKTTK